MGWAVYSSQSCEGKLWLWHSAIFRCLQKTQGFPPTEPVRRELVVHLWVAHLCSQVPAGSGDHLDRAQDSWELILCLAPLQACWGQLPDHDWSHEPDCTWTSWPGSQCSATYPESNKPHGQQYFPTKGQKNKGIVGQGLGGGHGDTIPIDPQTYSHIPCQTHLQGLRQITSSGQDSALLLSLWPGKARQSLLV